MLHQGQWKNQTLTISIKPNCATVSLGSLTVLSYDLAGRLWTAMMDGVSFRRGLDGKIVAKWQEQDRRRSRRTLTADEASQLIDHARATLEEIIRAIQGQNLDMHPPLDPQAFAALQAASQFSFLAAAEDALNYHTIYKPVGILPPDQYMAVVLQAAEGCSFNTCTFCDFYRDRPFRIKPLREFRQHCQDVKNFLGKGLSLRRTIFLGDANALVIPMPRLLGLMEIVNEEFSVDQLGGIFAFLDGFSGEKKSRQDYERLKQLGLARIYIGMESGCQDLLTFLKKPGRADDVIKAVQIIKNAGLAVGIIILLGAGGWKYYQRHVEDTVKAVNQMPLDLEDIIYFSELIEGETLPYVQDAYLSQLNPLTPAERLQQAEEIEHALSFSEAGGTPHISRYDIREFVY